MQFCDKLSSSFLCSNLISAKPAVEQKLFFLSPTIKIDTKMSTTDDIIPVNNKEENVTFFKKRSSNKNIRKRKAPVKVDSDDDNDDSDDDDDGGLGGVVVSEVVTKSRKTGANPFVQSTRKRRVKKGSDIDDDDDEQEEGGIGVQYTADRSATIKRDDAATRYDTEWELEKKELDNKKKNTNEPTVKKDVMNAKMSVGPQRAPANLRVTQRFDYQPDICKDYKGKNEYIL